MVEKVHLHPLNALMDKPVILFGAGNIAEKTMKKVGHSNVSFIVDNSTNLHGTALHGLPVTDPKEVSSEYLTVICTTDIENVQAQLKQLGLVPGKDFVLSPLLNDLLAIYELEKMTGEFYFTSGTVPREDGKRGGGLYHCRILGEEYSIEKIYSGQCYGAIQKDAGVLFVDTNKGILKYQNDETKVLCELPKSSRGHGISYNSELDRYYVSCSKADVILEFDNVFNLTQRFLLSDKIKNLEEPAHHVNDNYSIGNSLYVSMFSSTGNWKKDIFDGCIAEFDIATGERRSDVASNLYMPHNVQIIDGAVHVLDSLRGHLRFGNLGVQGSFSGFTRGLGYSGGLYFVGQSKNRNYSRVVGVSNNTSIDCGVVVFNPDLKVSRFLQFPPGIGEIHSVVVA